VGSPDYRAALLVVRAWREESGELRVRITEVPDLAMPAERVSLAGTRDELHSALDRWLDHLLRV
jgi:hypothetical protein